MNKKILELFPPATVVPPNKDTQNGFKFLGFRRHIQDFQIFRGFSSDKL